MSSGYSARHFSAMRPWVIILVITHMLQVACAQQFEPPSTNILIQQLTTGPADTARVELLLKLSTIYYNKTLNPVADMDSAELFARRALDVAGKLRFEEGQDKATCLIGKIYIRQRNTARVRQMLATVSIENRAKLLLELGKRLLRTTYTEESNRDSALFYFRKAGSIIEETANEDLKEESKCLIGVVYLLNGDWQQGKKYFDEVIDARQRVGDKAGELNTLLRMVTTVFCDNCQENLLGLNHALTLSRQIGDRSIEAIIQLEMGYKHLIGGNIKLAEQYALAASDIQKAIGYPSVCRAYRALANQSVYYAPVDYAYLSNANYLLSDIGQINGDLNQKLLYILEVARDVDKSGMHDELDYTYFRLGNAYWELGEFDKSMDYHRKSATISNQKGQSIHVGLARRNAVALNKQGRHQEALLPLLNIIDKGLLCSIEDKMYIAQSLGACYNALRQYQRAEDYYLESIAWSKQAPLRFQFLAGRGISQFYVENGKYTQAEPYLNQLLKASRQQIPPNYLISVHHMRFKVDSAKRNYPEAIRHYQMYKALQDSMYNETKSKQISQLSIQYETAKKEQDIKMKEMDIALLKEQNSSQRNQRNALIAGAVLLLALLALSFNRYRLKQRVNRKLQVQEQTLQLQQQQIRKKNEHLSELLAEKDGLLAQKDNLIKDKDQLLTEKEWLLKEIHHRVKNNFHIVASLLEIQSSYLKNKEALSAVKESQHRINSMSIIHQKLYQNNSFSTISMSEYIYELVEYLRDSFGIRDSIGFSLQIENIELNHATAMTLGLILNEGITNAIKYAFVQTKNGRISISLSRISEARALLAVQDNGSGLPKTFPRKLGGSMGMDLLQGLTEDIGGQLSIENNNGTCLKVIFKHAAVDSEKISFS